MFLCTGEGESLIFRGSYFAMAGMRTEYLVADTTTSNLSAVNIGHNSVTDRHKGMRKHFREEAQDIQKFTKGVHHTRKDCYMQTAYASTVGKLCIGQSMMSGASPTLGWPKKEESALKPPKLESSSSNPAVREQYSKFIDTMNKNARSEFSINDRRLRYNKECGRVSKVDEIISNKPLPPGRQEEKVYLFPQKANHTQILALTGKLSMPDVRKPPPDIPRRKRDPNDIIG